MSIFKIGCHVSAAGGVYNAPSSAADLGCETFQIFTRPPMGGKAPELTKDGIAQFHREMEKYQLTDFVVHCPYFINFGSAEPRIYHSSISVVAEELKRANSLGAKYVMTHLGSAKVLGKGKAIKQAKEGLAEVLKKYQGKTQFLLEIAAGAGEIIGGTYEQLAELMEPLVKFKTFGGICFDTQHAFASGYDLRDDKAVSTTFKQFDKIIGLKYLKMSHINDSKIDLGGKKDRHEHIGQGKIGEKGFLAFLAHLNKLSFNNPARPPARAKSSLGRSGTLPSPGEGNNAGFASFPLIFETEHDKVKADIEILKKLRNKI